MVTSKLPPLFRLAILAIALALSAPRAENAKSVPGSSSEADVGGKPPAPAAPAGAMPAPAKAASLQKLPDFTLPDLEGKAHSSREWQGKVVLVDFWATWCVGCRETIPALVRLQEKYGPQGLAVVGISLDQGAKAKVGKFARKLKVNYQMLLDSEDTLSPVFGFEGLPSLYLFDAQGNLIKTMVGYTAVQDKGLEALVAAQFKGRP